MPFFKGVLILATASLGMTGCAQIADPYVDARTAGDCRAFDTQAGQTASILNQDRGISRGIREAQLTNCLRRVALAGGDATLVLSSDTSGRVRSGGLMVPAGTDVHVARPAQTTVPTKTGRCNAVMVGGAGYCVR